MTPRDKSTRVPIKIYANEMRLAPTACELKLYHALLQVFAPYSATVRPQEPIGPYIVDFYIAPCNFVVEVDGPSHFTPEGKAHDKKRDAYMHGKHITVYRFQNRQIHRNPNACARYILQKAMPLEARERTPKITYCPPGSALHKTTNAERRIFWKA